ncbi:MAG: ATP-binding protein [Actinobacteria bacterium BACL4 MAG-120820-bin23]|uniref:GTPase HflX n=1 Tax=Candidatus Nanopelagicus sp. TaxID=2518620 RepID=UPI000715B372|nr:MAG: ATP-binding protein [Actinobacteria bacterium BACL4 MAG-120820-bin23]KRO77358.1 MAG: ATP-binding protein [Actinobacteria bacterium BACL4 MAG-120920-bin74]MDA2998193.1 GTPase HflX [Actinomycetota bacterium]
MTDSKFDKETGLELDIDSLIRENAQAVAEYELNENPESSNQDLQDRQALRRVSGLSTELQDVTDSEYRQLRLEKVVLVGVWTEGTSTDADNSIKELAALAETAGSTVMDALIQRRDKPDAATFIGSGKVKEVREAVVATGADTVVCDGELSPAQLRTLEQKVKVKVIDRTALILDIFAQHAKSREGKAQVELAQMSYMLPRLRGWGESLSRQAGGIGGRGPGETKIETDRRRINDKMAKLRREIKEMKISRDTKRSERRKKNIPSVAIAGYTNAGKSSLLNRLTGADVLVENALFATLDPTVRKTESADGRIYTLVDTVGFVRHLPHQLVEAFKSTLEEVSEADLIVHVVDGSHPDPFEQLRAVREVINEIGGGEIMEIIAVNKADVASPEVLMEILRKESNAYAISARTGYGIENLIRAVEAALPKPKVEIKAIIPFSRGDLVSAVHEQGEIISEEYLPEGTKLHAMVGGALARKIELL